MYTISEEEFYKTCDKAENIKPSDFPYDYIPSIKELQILKIEEHLDQHLLYLLYLSNDPYGTEQSRQLAKFIKNMLNENLAIV